MNANRVIGVGSLLVVLAFSGLLIAQDKPRPTTPATPAAKQKEQVLTATNSAAPSDFPVIGYIEKRDRTITIMAGPKGPVYSVKTAAGKVLCDKVSLDQLRVQAPELHQFIKSAVAANSGKGGTVDASVRPQKVR